MSRVVPISAASVVVLPQTRKDGRVGTLAEQDPLLGDWVPEDDRHPLPARTFKF